MTWILSYSTLKTSIYFILSLSRGMWHLNGIFLVKRNCSQRSDNLCTSVSLECFPMLDSSGIKFTCFHSGCDFICKFSHAWEYPRNIHYSGKLPKTLALSRRIMLRDESVVSAVRNLHSCTNVAFILSTDKAESCKRVLRKIHSVFYSLIAIVHDFLFLGFVCFHTTSKWTTISIAISS